MRQTFNILNLNSIFNLEEDKDKQVMVFQQGKHLKVTSETLRGIALWMRANKHNGGYYSLDLGDVTIDAARPHGNHHDTHKQRLSIVLARFRPWCNIDSETVAEDNEFHDNGIVYFKDAPAFRVFRKKNMDYQLEVAHFVKFNVEKSNG